MNNSMKTKKFTSTVFALALGLGVAFGLNYVFATANTGAFVGPSSPFPNCPTTDDSCNTPLNVGTNSQVKNGNLSVNVLTGYMNSEFKQNLTVDQLAVTSTDRTVCADSSGNLTLCNISGAVKVNPQGFQPNGIVPSLQVTGISGFSQPAPYSAIYVATHNVTGGSTVTVNYSYTGTMPASPFPGVVIAGIKNGTSWFGCVIVRPGAPTSGTFFFTMPALSISDSVVIETESPGNACQPTN